MKTLIGDIFSSMNVNNFSWNDIESVTPDETDRKMLSDIERDPDCKVFVPADEVVKELGL